MTVAKAYSVSLIGLVGTIIEIEAEISSNLPSFVLVGLPDASLSEARDRVRAAAHNSGLPLPGRRVTVNLSPASVPKRGSIFDLAISLAIFSAGGRVRADSVTRWIHLGELGLDGTLRGVSGVLPAVLAAKRAGYRRIIVPTENLGEAMLVDDIEILGATNLAQVAKFHGAELTSGELLPVVRIAKQGGSVAEFGLDLADIIGQDQAVDALTLAAAGGHNLLMVGPPGVGKTMLAERLPSILPVMTSEEALETRAIESIAGGRTNRTSVGLETQRPFQAPHHSATLVSLIGGGATFPRPGLVSLANHGVLFLDEAPEFSRGFLEALRQPLESGEVLINRSAGFARFPARFQLVMAANPCPCGNFAGKGRACVCLPSSRLSYLSKLSGPLLDRIDLRIRLETANPAQVALARVGAQQLGRSSSEIRARVELARSQARKRLAGTPWQSNAQVPGAYLRKQLMPKSTVTRSLDQALERGLIGMRGYDRCLRLAWTSADLDARQSVLEEDIAKAVLLRGGDGVTSW